MATLEVGQSSSVCSACRGGAVVSEPAHLTRIGYGVEPGTAGCGEVFTHVTTFYPGASERVKAMRPDLEFVGWE